MKQKEIIEAIIIQLRKSSLAFEDLYANNYSQKGIRKSEFSSCIKELKENGFVNYDGNFDDTIDVVLTRFGEDMIARHGTYSEYLKYSSTETLYDRVIKWGKNNVIVVSIMLLLLIATQYKNIKDFFTQKSKPDPIIIVKQPIDTIPTFNFESEFSEINSLVRNKMEKDGFILRDSGAKYKIKLISDPPGNPQDANGSAIGFDFYYDSTEARMSFNSQVPIRLGIIVKKTALKKSPEGAVEEFKKAYEKAIRENIEKLYHAIQEHVHK